MEWKSNDQGFDLKDSEGNALATVEYTNMGTSRVTVLSSLTKTFGFGLEDAKVEAEMLITEAYCNMTKEPNVTPAAIEQKGDVSRLIKHSQMQRDQRKNDVSLSR